MALAAGTKLGPYEVLGPLGAGGMGEVYRARDTRLERTVAVKVLPAHLSSDPELKQRLEREAKAISALNHPNICTLHDVGSQDGTDFLVMEYIEGETLAGRLRKKALPLDQIVKIGMEIASALDRAHRAGIIHRDLKPGNIMLTATGAKLMDFGLAWTTQPERLEPRVSLPSAPPSPDAPTATIAVPPMAAPLTAYGAVVGTIQYVSPEQLEGKPADARSDIFALGAVLYEMATGRRAFDGASAMSVANAIREKTPEPISSVQPGLPAALDVIVRTCLAKDPEERYASAHDVKLQLKLAGESQPPGDTTPASAGTRAREKAVAAALIVTLAMAGWLGYGRWRQAQAPRQVVESSLELPGYALSGAAGAAPRTAILSLALSPDGQYLAFKGKGAGGGSQIWLRPLRASAAYPLPGTEGGNAPFWSPDGRSLAFFANGQLKKVALAGGVVTTVCITSAYSGAWGANDTIVLGGAQDAPLLRVAAAGGQPEPITGTLNGTGPFFLPDGRHFLYVEANEVGTQVSAKVGALDGSAPVNLGIRVSSRVVYAPGYLVYTTGTRLVAQGFDTRRLRATEPPQVLVESGQSYFAAASPFTASQNGLLAYSVLGGSGGEEIQLFTAEGRMRPSGIPAGFVNNPRLSPDGKRIAYDLLTGGNRDIWVFDLERQVNTRLTPGDGMYSDPLWSPDGGKIAYTVWSQKGFALATRPATGGAQETLLETPRLMWARSWSADGRYLFVDSITRESDSTLVRGIQALDLSDKRLIALVPDDKFYRRAAEISPDGRWLAYVSNESGREDVYVQSFPGNANRVQVSSGGGVMPRWRGDGRELYYIAADQKVAAVEIRTKGDRIDPGKTRELFAVNPLYPGGNPLDVTRDGKLFVVATVQPGQEAPVRLISNWDALVEH